MRTIRYRDVLWAAAYRIGLDPVKEFLSDQADACASYINSWIRRLYDSQDWPEWTVTRRLIPNSGNVVPYNVDQGVIIGHDRFETIGRVFNVYLLDPATTTEPFETPFDLQPDGVFVGFEHGPAVWVKYIPACPQFTSTPWVADFRYGRGDLVYLSRTGECYKSRTPNNKGHDPSVLFSHQGENNPVGNAENAIPPSVTLDIVQDKQSPQQGVLASSQHTTIGFTGLTPSPDPPSIPALNDAFFIEVKDSAGTLLGSSSQLGNGVKTLATIITDMATDLAAMAGFTATPSTADSTIELVAPQEFMISWSYWQPLNSKKYNLRVVRTQVYNPAVAGTAGLPQIITATFTDDQLATGATYGITVIGPDGVEHVAEYTALSTDTIQQVITGLVDAMTTSPDIFFNAVRPSVDLTLNTLTFTTDDVVSADVTIEIPASAWWELVSFPQALADPIIRGQVSDIYREEGQTDRSDGEEKKVETELGVAAAKFTTLSSDQLTSQQKPRSRYSVK